MTDTRRGIAEVVPPFMPYDIKDLNLTSIEKGIEDQQDREF